MKVSRFIDGDSVGAISLLVTGKLEKFLITLFKFLRKLYCNCESGNCHHGRTYRSSPQEVYLGKSVWKICSKFTGEDPCRSVISTKLLWTFIEIALREECSSVYLLHIYKTSFLKNTYGGLLPDA